MGNILLSIGGFYCIAFFIFHLSFWKLFRWKTDLQRITPINRAVIQVLNLRLTYVFLFVGIMLFLFQVELLETKLGKFFLIAMSIFWFMRAIEQIIFFSRKKMVSWMMFVLFTIGGALFLIPAL